MLQSNRITTGDIIVAIIGIIATIVFGVVVVLVITVWFRNPRDYIDACMIRLHLTDYQTIGDPIGIGQYNLSKRVSIGVDGKQTGTLFFDTYGNCSVELNQ